MERETLVDKAQRYVAHSAGIRRLDQYAGRRVALKLSFKSRRFRWTVVFLLVTLVVVASTFLLLPWILIAPSQTPPSDVLLHFAISPFTNTDEYVADLYRQKVAKKIVCITGASVCAMYPADYARQHLLELGVPAEDVLTLHLPSADCLAPNMPHLIEMMKPHSWQQALLVVPPPFSRTNGSVAAKYFHREGLQLAVTHVPSEQEGFTFLWWTKHKPAQTIVDATINGMLDQLYPECR